MSNDAQSHYPGASLVVPALASAAAILGYYGYEAALPPCGPPTNSFLGDIYFLVPVALVVVEALVVAGLGSRRAWGRNRTVGSVLGAVVLTLIGGFFVWLHFFALGNCGE
jgi:hypothetical protein